jgi:HSP20 family protein
MNTKTTDLEKVGVTPSRGLTPFEEMDRMFDTLLSRGWMRPFRELWPEWAGLEGMTLRSPHVDLIDREGELLVRAELPGVDKKDLEVSLTGNSLTVRAETRRETKEEKGEYFRAEIAQGAFSRVLQLPEEILPQEVQASFENGILEVHLPKAHKVEPRKIEVK